MWISIEDMVKQKKITTFGGRLKMAREDAQLTQEELAALLQERYGVSVGRSYLSELERNWESNKMPMSDVTAALAQALDVNGNWLLLISDEQEPPDRTPVRSMSPEGDELANIADDLPDWRRRELLEVARVMAQTAGEMAPVAQAMTGEMRAQLAAAQLVIGEPAVRAMEAVLVRFLTGNAPGADRAAVGQGSRRSSSKPPTARASAPACSTCWRTAPPSCAAPTRPRRISGCELICACG